MTAKEALLARIDGLCEADADVLMAAADPSFMAWLEELSRSTSTAELLKLPRPLRSLITRYEARFYTEADSDEAVAEAEEWRFSDADALKHIDD